MAEHAVSDVGLTKMVTVTKRTRAPMSPNLAVGVRVAPADLRRRLPARVRKSRRRSSSLRSTAPPIAPDRRLVR